MVTSSILLPSSSRLILFLIPNSGYLNPPNPAISTLEQNTEYEDVSFYSSTLYLKGNKITLSSFLSLFSRHKK
jgi:hypothetical protein